MSSGGGADTPFVSSSFTIRIKLLLVITGIVVLSLGLMLIVATAIFRSHGESLIQYYNLLLVRQNGHQIAQRLRDLDSQARLLAQLPPGRAADEALFFRRNPRVLYLGIAGAGAGLPIARGMYNENLFARYELTAAVLNDARSRRADEFARARDGVTVFRNLSSVLKLPVVGVSLPPERTGGPVIVLVLLAEDLLGSMRAGDNVFQLSVLDGTGAVIAHTDEAVTLAAAAHGEIPIVRRMLGSSIDNGSLKYRHDGHEYLGSFHSLDFGTLGVVSTVETDLVFREVDRLQLQTAVIMLIVFLLAFLFVFFYSRTISVPIVRLVGATRMIEDGDYDVDIRPSSGDEIGRLTAAFVHMAGGLKEKERIKDVFGKFVNPHVAEQALSAEARLGGQRKQCAIFFSDLRNFTGLSESITPEQVVEFLNQYFTSMRSRTGRHRR